MNRSFWVILVSFCSQVMRRPCRPWTIKKCIFSMARPASRWDRENNGRAGCATGNGLLSSSRWPRVAIRGQREKGGEGAEGPQQSHQAPSGTLGPPRSAIRGERSSPLQLAAPFVGRLDGVGGGGGGRSFTYLLEGLSRSTRRNERRCLTWLSGRPAERACTCTSFSAGFGVSCKNNILVKTGCYMLSREGGKEV